MSSPRRVWDIPQLKSTLQHYSFKIWDLLATILIIFLRINWPNWQMWCSWNVCLYLVWGIGRPGPLQYPLPPKLPCLHDCPWRHWAQHVRGHSCYTFYLLTRLCCTRLSMPIKPCCSSTSFCQFSCNILCGATISQHLPIKRHEITAANYKKPNCWLFKQQQIIIH